MLAVIRHYEHVGPAAATTIADARTRIEALLGAVPGTHEALLIRTRDGIALVAIGTDEWCLAECGRRFRGWVEAPVNPFAGADEARVSIGHLIGSINAQSLSPSPGKGRGPAPRR